MKSTKCEKIILSYFIIAELAYTNYVHMSNPAKCL